MVCYLSNLKKKVIFIKVLQKLIQKLIGLPVKRICCLPASNINGTTQAVKMICSDFLEFQDVLKKMRVLDDKIVYALNTSLPTESFRKTVDTGTVCQDLLSQIQKGHADRENIIKNCIVITAESVKKFKAAKDIKPDDFETLKDLKAEQRKLRLLQTELSVEEVIQDKTTKLFTEKCRAHYKPQ